MEGIEKQIEEAERKGDFPEWSRLMKELGNPEYKNTKLFRERYELYNQQTTKIEKRIEEAARIGDFPNWSRLMQVLGNPEYRNIKLFGEQYDLYNKQPN